MKRDKKLKEQRAEHVKKVVNKSKTNTCETVKKLAKKLYLSERTIWDDLKK